MPKLRHLIAAPAIAAPLTLAGAGLASADYCTQYAPRSGECIGTTVIVNYTPRPPYVRPSSGSTWYYSTPLGAWTGR